MLEISGLISRQPNLEVALGSLRRLMSSVADFDSISLLLLDATQKMVRLEVFDRDADVPDLAIGLQLSVEGTPLAQCIETQEAVYVPDSVSEFSKIPELAERVLPAGVHSLYIVPVSTQRKKLGILVFGTREHEFRRGDLELMMSVAAHVAMTLENAATLDKAAEYQHQLAKERDRLGLLLEINNHVVSKLEMTELFRSASASIRRYFANDFTGFWLLHKETSQLECAVLDFPGTRGFLEQIDTRELTDEDMSKMRRHLPEIWSPADIENLPAGIREPLKAESIVSFAVSPLVTANGPLGLITMGSRRPNAFGQADLDLLGQISNQIALALDNAVAYGRLTASKQRLEEERLYLEDEIRAEYNFENIVGKSSALRKVLNQIAIVAPTGSTVLLHGETGTGKELIARAIHVHSPRKDRTFVRLNCAAIPSGLVESELFGHEKGAFTGALMQKRGRFELADHGTLFLDEIGDISLDLQPKLLRALQEHEFERLGSTRTIKVDVRVIAATHRNLTAMIQNNEFREDLYYRLNVFPVEVPPLRERRDDIPLLVHYFVAKLASRMQKKIKVISADVMQALVNAAWPGNIRELENFIERCVILSPGEQLIVPLPEVKRQTSASISTFHQTERQAIIDALRASSGKIAGPGGAAERLGLKRTTLQNKMRRLDVAKIDYTNS